MVELPDGTVTFLLTDVEGSTALWEQAPESMRTALARHDALFEDAVRTHAGVHIRPRGEGDSRFAVFPSAADAVAAALAVQRAFATEPWPTPRPVKVRIGVHTGEAELREGDYYGSAVNRCARIRGIGHGGQTLLSGATATLVRERLPSSVSLLDLGEHRLKDLTRPEHVSQLTALDLPAQFPPLASLNARSHNLPVHPTALLGRDRELAEIHRLFQDGARLVTLTGPGGTGKTRLSLQVAAELLDHVEDGVFLVELAPLSDPSLVPTSIAQVLGVRDVGERAAIDALKEYLRTRSLVLVLDNFEQIMAAAQVVADLLTASPGLRVLVTSREPLRLRGEHEYAVPPLALPDIRLSSAPGPISRFAAVALFLERATTIRSDFTITSENAVSIADICTRLDGLPLAIELAAARVRLLTPQAIVGRLDRRLPLLTGGARDLPTRQQTLRGTIAWSYDLLDEAERRLFRRLAVFVGGWTLESADAVCRVDQADVDTLDGLESLVAKSLVRQDAAGPDSRFRMLETIREYAVEQLEVSHEMPLVRRRHAEHCLTLAEEAESKSGGGEQRAWLERLEAEHDNVRAALEWSLLASPEENSTVELSDRRSLGLRLAASLWEFWLVHGDFREGRQWLDRALAANPEAAPHVRGKALRGAGQLIYSQGDYEEGLALDGEALALYGGIGDTHSAAWVLIGIGTARRNQRDYPAAGAVFGEALALFRDLGDRWGIAWSLNGLGNVAQEMGEHARAEEMLTEAMARFKDLGDRRGGAWATLSFGHDARIQGDRTRARQLFDTALSWFQELDNRRGVLHTTQALGLLAHDGGDALRARDLLQEALRQSRELGDQRGTYESVEWLAAVAGARGQLVRAARLHGAAEALRETKGTALPPADRARLEQVLDAVRATLGHSDFTVAVAAGHAMSMEQAIAYAVADDAADSAPPIPQGESCPPR